MARNPGIPHYRRIVELLLAGTTGTDVGRLPSERALALRHGVSRSTARRALEELRKRGYVSRLQGSGTYHLSKSSRLIYGFGYFLETPFFARLFEWMRHRLAGQDCRLIALDTGLRGENMTECFRIDEVRQSDAVFWLAPSHPDGLRAAILARRKLPARLPMLLVNDPLGLSLQGPHRFDLVHYDHPQAARRLVQCLLRDGFRFPVLVRRSDVRIFSIEEAERGFVSALEEQGNRNARQHVLKWDPERPETLRNFWRDGLSASGPDVVILPYHCETEFRGSCEKAGVPCQEMRVIVFGGEGALWKTPMDFRDIAEVSAELLLSRLQRPSRVNLRVAIPLPVLRAVGPKKHFSKQTKSDG